MNVALLLLIVAVSAVMVRLGAFALELTGVPWDQAKFQALSAFTTSGYTTREAEQIMAHPMRRRIISTLIVLGNAGIVTAIGSFAGTMMKGDALEVAMDAGIMFIGVMVVFALMRHDGLTGGVRRRVQAWMQRRWNIQPPRPEEMLRLDEGYALTRITIDDASPVAGKTLAQAKLTKWRVHVLGIERGGQYFPVPRGDDRMLAGDELVVYGDEPSITSAFRPRSRTKLTIMGDATLAGSMSPHAVAPASTEAITSAPTVIAGATPAAGPVPSAPAWQPGDGSSAPYRGRVVNDPPGG